MLFFFLPSHQEYIHEKSLLLKKMFLDNQFILILADASKIIGPILFYVYVIQ
jgi:hypothetical protein